MEKKYQIVKILDASTFIINGGSSDGIVKGTEFSIIDANASPIKDLNNNVIGSYAVSKGTIYATEVQEKMTVCMTGTRENMPSVSAVFEDLRTYEHQIELNVDPADIDTSYDSDEPVRVGDFAEIINEQKNQNE
ncbi:hypothetical protein [Lacticaseibacillus paracasei]|uniref:hypothetical protein n=2 Tax=Lacticaseibacillus paracasei TaxID=1597 RepID=UPI001892991F|nr:hypothetical protein [Lacticaseibacillus paracasei]MCI0372969.1 hypothetical protein [Lacticaseibacillus paracasei]QPC18875.1 hypothetical protein LacP0734_14815 [Lacticaseibacillus paracasei subsp. tolerans]